MMHKQSGAIDASGKRDDETKHVLLFDNKKAYYWKKFLNELLSSLNETGTQRCQLKVLCNGFIGVSELNIIEDVDEQ